MEANLRVALWTSSSVQGIQRPTVKAERGGGERRRAAGRMEGSAAAPGSGTGKEGDRGMAGGGGAQGIRGRRRGAGQGSGAKAATPCAAALMANL